MSVGEGVLAVVAGDSGAGVSGSGTSAVTLTGTIAQINAVFGAGGTSGLTYLSNLDAPSASTQLTLSVHDNGNSGGGDLSASATATINISAVNDPPTASLAATYAAVEQTGLSLKNAGLSIADPDAGSGFVTAVLAVGQGVLTVTAGGSGATVSGSGTNSVQITGALSQINSLLNTDPSSTISYLNSSDIPPASTSLTLTVHDNGSSGVGGDLVGAATSTITIAAVNDAPVTAPDSGSVASGATLQFAPATLLANDSDPDGDVLTLTGVQSGPTAHGTVSFSGGTISYVANAGYSGADSFTYYVTDGKVASPVAGIVNVTVTAGSNYTLGTPGNDVIDRSALTAGQQVNGQDGNDTITGGSGADSLNGANGNDVIRGGPGADTLTGGPGADTFVFAPTDFTAGPAYDTIADFSGAGNGAVAGDDVLQLTGFSASATLVNVANNTSKHTYEVVDGSNHYRFIVTYSGTAALQPGDYVFVNSSGGNHAPVSANDSYALSEDSPLTVAAGAGLLANDVDPDGNSLTAVLTSGPSHGVLTLNANGSFVYTPNANYAGADSFSYQSSDGSLTSQTAIVSLSVADVNDAPSAGLATSAYGATEQTSLNLKGTGISVGDIDAGSGSLTATLTVGQGVLNVAAGGSGAGVSGSGTSTVTILGMLTQINALLSTDASSAVSYLNPNDAPAASTSLTLTVHDNGSTGGGDLSATANATINITAVNDAPLVVADSAAATAGTPLGISAATLLANDTDPDGNTLTVTGVQAGATAHGTVSFSGGVVTYTASAGYSGSDSFIYFVTDGIVGSPVAGTVNVTVSAPTGGGSTYTSGTAGNDLIDRSAFSGAQLVNGGDGNDTITGGSAADTLNGANGNDVIRGGPGADILTGGSGLDTFAFGPGDFPASGIDTISDFSRTQGDLMSLALIDADLGAAGDQAFAFIGSATFSGAAGQLRYAVTSGGVMVSGDVNGDGIADFQFKVAGVSLMQSSDFLL